MAKLIFGCGYLGLRVARLWLGQGAEVHAVTRSVERAREFTSLGLLPLVGDVAGPSEIAVPQGVETIVWAVGHDRTSAQSIYDVYVRGLAAVLHRLAPTARRFIYISSTGVYGHVTDSEVDESTPCLPAREGGKACLAAEDLLRASPLADRTIILRLAGIYGPQRIPRSHDLVAGKPIDAPSDGWLNLIHVEDAARIVLLAEQKVQPPQLYVVSDGQPVIRGDYYRELARLLGAPPPQFSAPRPDPPAVARAASDKKVNPRKLFAELSPHLMYPSYREGLASITKP